MRVASSAPSAVQITAETGAGFDSGKIFSSEGQGKKGTTTASQKCSESGENGKERGTQRKRGNFIGIAGLPDEKSICHIVENHDQHNQNSGYTKRKK